MMLKYKHLRSGTLNIGWVAAKNQNQKKQKQKQKLFFIYFVLFFFYC